jgi:hypothetical protein
MTPCRVTLVVRFIIGMCTFTLPSLSFNRPNRTTAYVAASFASW